MMIDWHEFRCYHKYSRCFVIIFYINLVDTFCFFFTKKHKSHLIYFILVVIVFLLFRTRGRVYEKQGGLVDSFVDQTTYRPTFMDHR